MNCEECGKPLQVQEGHFYHAPPWSDDDLQDGYLDAEDDIDVHGHDPHRYSDGLVLTALEQTCGACPSQWDAWVNDVYLYVRYRWGWLTVTLGPGDDGGHLFCKRIGDDLDGVMDTDMMLRTTGMSVS